MIVGVDDEVEGDMEVMERGRVAFFNIYRRCIHFGPRV